MNLNSYAKLLGYSGLIPFVALPCFNYLEIISPHNSLTLFIQYSAVILAFFGGIHWHDALSRTSSKSQMSIAMLPSLIAWLSLFYPSGAVSLSLLAGSFIFMLIYDLRILNVDKQYRILRINLTIVTVLMHAVVAVLLR
ncbi:DUF3429 domain-containing protein [Paraglaciecola sp. 25GB23A]|uniref:DUF3429 domain-containing protein n=1 Tax=Paraglaciecola sp. 25GB23A TaxID=3156068 RepID=UPI0032AFF11B